MSKQLRLESMSINFQDYGTNKGKYEGTMKFKGQYGHIEIVLAPELSQEVLRLCADALVSNAKSVAESMSAEVFEQADNLLPPAGADLTDINDDL